MRYRLRQFIVNNFLRHRKDNGATNSPSPYKMAKSLYQLRRAVLQNSRDAVLIIIGILSAGFGLKSFLLPVKFIDGGATGISLLSSALLGWPLALMIVLINLPFILIGYRLIGKGFTIKAIMAIAGLSICLAVVDYPIVTSDKLLVAVFGGFFLGAGIGFTVRGGGVLDGTEILAIYLSRKLGTTIGDVIMMINVLIFSTVAYFLGIDNALYSMLTYLAASKTVDFLIEGIEEYTGVTIISPKSEEISRVITEKLGRGITVYKGAGGYGKRGYVQEDQHIVFTVITRLEISKLKHEIEMVDPHAFVVMHSIKDTNGGMIKKRPLKH
ncbi:YitT family protein [Pseudoflavitalea rhizosphaerae]|uniref:YitT family protein n=1 Tax=Pseudoflavitalea rhizosphaerae TaxID=1884793 RepID=UPI000F8F4203|nr:YitT family protein [Pseudoflavitalea rhizosphaerae]